MTINTIINKLNKKVILNKKEIEYVVNNYVNGNISDPEMTRFLKAVCKNNLTFRETLYLTDVMLNSGDIIDLKPVKRICVDKHSTGGVGDKVSLIVGPVVASLGLAMPKMSGKGLGITGGTIDKLESIPGYKVKIDEEEYYNIINEVGVSIISQSKNIVPADKKIYALRDVTNTVNNMSLIASSIMSKKLASSCNAIVIDMKVGKGAFMQDVKDATKLSKMMIKIAKKYKRKLVCVLTDMNVPLGYNIGNSLEVKEVIDFFDGKREKRLEEVIIVISSYLVSLGKQITLKQARKRVLNVLKNGKAKDTFYKWIEMQGGDISKLSVSDKVLDIRSNKEGIITNIDALTLGTIVRDLGAGRKKKEDKIDYGVGISLEKQVGDKVNKGDILCKVYYNKNKNFTLGEIINTFKIENTYKEMKVVKKIIRR